MKRSFIITVWLLSLCSTSFSQTPTNVKVLKFGDESNSGVAHTRYGIYQESGNWVNPYPKLIINYHTGVEYVGYKGYGGHQFYVGSGAIPGELAFSVGNGDNNTRVKYKLFIEQAVGIGTSIPDGVLSVVGNKQNDEVKLHMANLSSSGYSVIRFNTSETGSAGAALHRFNSGWNSSTPMWESGSIALWEGDGAVNIGAKRNLKFYTGSTSDERLRILGSGEVVIGTKNAANGYLLTIDGKAVAEEIKVENVTGADFVFDKNYPLTDLESTARYIQQNKHLPDIPSAPQMQQQGIHLGEMNMLLLQKIEELTLHLIDQHQEIKKLKADLLKLKQH